MILPNLLRCLGLEGLGLKLFSQLLLAVMEPMPTRHKTGNYLGWGRREACYLHYALKVLEFKTMSLLQ